MRNRSAVVGLVAVYCLFGIAAVPAQVFENPHPDWEARPQPQPTRPLTEAETRALRGAGLPAYVVRAYYMVPANREPQEGAIERMQYLLLAIQRWYADQMEVNGFGPKTFALEMEADGRTPKVHLVEGTQPDTWYNEEPWSRVNNEATAAGLPIWGQGQVWFGMFETHLMNPDGSLQGGFNGGASFGSGGDAGVAITSSITLAMTVRAFLRDNAAYDGRVFPLLGPYPAEFGITFASFDGTTVSEIASVSYGISPHELGHGFGMGHDFRNDRNFNGNMMGNGFRGMRGWFYTHEFPEHFTRLSYADALHLNYSRYFNHENTFTDNMKPSVTLILPTGIITPTTGLLGINFQADDAGGLASAQINVDFNITGEMELSGTSVEETFLTPFYEKDKTHNITVIVTDLQGNRTAVDAIVAVGTGFNQAPRPHFSVNPGRVYAGRPFQIDASLSSDPDHPAATLTAEWDWDNDGTFDTPPSTEKIVTHTYTTPGVRQIRLRLTDPAGAQFVSTPLGVRVWPVPAAFAVQ